jgi:hypothetical protein
VGRSGAELRPFAVAAGVRSRDYSGPLQRVLVDFGAEESFGRAVERVREHYGIEVPASAVRRQTEAHGAVLQKQQEEARLTELGPEPGVAVLITEIDGSMVPLVTTGAGAHEGGVADKRKTRQLHWAEARLCLARAPERVTARYGACLGSVAEAGEVWLDCAIRAGAGAQTHLHGVGDGAEWIAGQMAERFGEQGTYLCDFYHVSEYLGAAAVAEGRAWLHWAQRRLKANEVEPVLAELRARLEPAGVAEAEAPVRRCLRYLENRRAQLGYQAALQAGLPIGSGEIESGHRSVMQERLKLSGAWWAEENARKMLALRVTRANGEWHAYWQQQGKAGA